MMEDMKMPTKMPMKNAIHLAVTNEPTSPKKKDTPLPFPLLAKLSIITAHKPVKMPTTTEVKDRT